MHISFIKDYHHSIFFNIEMKMVHFYAIFFMKQRKFELRKLKAGLFHMMILVEF